MQPHSSPPFSSSQVRLGQSAPRQGSSTTPAKKENKQKHNLIFTPTHGSMWSHSGLATSVDLVRSDGRCKPTDRAAFREIMTIASNWVLATCFVLWWHYLFRPLQALPAKYCNLASQLKCTQGHTQVKVSGEDGIHRHV